VLRSLCVARAKSRGPGARAFTPRVGPPKPPSPRAHLQPASSDARTAEPVEQTAALVARRSSQGPAQRALEPSETLGTVASPRTSAPPTVRGDAQRTRAGEAPRASDAPTLGRFYRVRPGDRLHVEPAHGRVRGEGPPTVGEAPAGVLWLPPADPGWDIDARPLPVEVLVDGQAVAAELVGRRARLVEVLDRARDRLRARWARR
jgi:hypothetical protein